MKSTQNSNKTSKKRSANVIIKLKGGIFKKEDDKNL